MERFTSIIFLLIIPISFCLAQNVGLDWVATFGTSQMDGATNVCLDNDGNVIVGGYYSDKIDVDPSDGIEYLEHVDDQDAYIVKLNPSGELIWALGLCGEDIDRITDIQVDDMGNIYVAGYFYGNIDVDPSSETFIFNSMGESDAFICKYDPNGQLIWAKEIGNEAYNFCEAFVLDDFGNLFISAIFKGTLDCDPNEGVENLESFNNRYDAFLLKLNREGQFVWVQHFEGESYDKIQSIDIDEGNNIYLTGYFYNNIDLDPSEDTAIFYSHGGEDIFICKLNMDGDLIWANSMGAEDDDKAFKIVLDSFNNFYISGYYYHRMDFDPGNEEYTLNGYYNSGYIAKYNSAGELIWARNVSNPQSSYISDMKTDAKGNIWIAGYYWNDCDFDPSSDQFMLHNVGDYNDVFVLNLNENGQLNWAQSFNGLGQGSGQGLDIDIDEDKNVFTVGAFSSFFDFDPSEEIVNVLSKGYQDGFVHKMSSCKKEIHETITACNGFFVSPSGLIWDEPGSYMDTLVTPHICDSIFHIDLEFISLDNSITINYNILKANHPATHYQWIYYDKEEAAEPIYGAEEQSYTARTGGHYAVIIEYNDCIDTSAFYKLDDILFGEVEMRKITVFPNPSTGRVYIDLGGGLFEKVSVGLFDAFGNLIQEQEIESDYYLEMNIPEPGVYTMKIELEEAYILYKKVIIH